MAEHGPCKICANPAECDRVPHWTWRLTCRRCGMFEYDDAMRWPKPSPDKLMRLSGWVREQNAAGVVPRINREILRRVTNMRVPGLRERADDVLSVIARDHWKPDAWFVPETLNYNPELLGVSYSADQDELFLLFKIFKNRCCDATDMPPESGDN